MLRISPLTCNYCLAVLMISPFIQVFKSRPKLIFFEWVILHCLKSCSWIGFFLHKTGRHRKSVSFTHICFSLVVFLSGFYVSDIQERRLRFSFKFVVRWTKSSVVYKINIFRSRTGDSYRSQQNAASWTWIKAFLQGHSK